MAEVNVVEQGAGSYLVTVADHGTTTSHSVRIPEGLPEALGWGPVPAVELVRASFTFLLAREPATSILRSFTLDQIGDYFPDYRATMTRLLADSGDD